MTSAGGLRRFARPARSPATATTGAAGTTDTAAGAEERCELCRERLGHEHPHLVDLRRRSIACACQACALLFTQPGGRYRTVPDRVGADPDAPLTAAEWAELRIPVSTAFFFVNSALDGAPEPAARRDDRSSPAQGRVIACYPSPAGVTECELDLAAWDRLAAAHPLLRAMAPDVEAILVTGGGTNAIEAFLVPIVECYALAGALRLRWHGFDGGPEARQTLTDLLTDLRRRARPVANLPLEAR